jgi:hypothetical protein
MTAKVDAVAAAIRAIFFNMIKTPRLNSPADWRDLRTGLSYAALMGLPD